jgi:hypothetical protein
MNNTTRNLFGTLLVSLCSLLAACGQENAGESKTSVLVTIDSDLRDDVARVEVQILDARAEEVGSAQAFEIENDESWPVTFAVAPSRGKESGSFLVVARGLDREGGLLAESKGLLTFVKGKTTAAALWLWAACRGVTCDGLETCDGRGPEAGNCGAVPVLDTEVIESKPTGSDAPPTLMPPAPVGTGTSTGSSMPGGSDTEGGTATGTNSSVGADASSDAGADAAVNVPRVGNTPTLGGLSTLGEPRRTSDGLTLLDDGFELGERLCNSAGLCATASFAP